MTGAGGRARSVVVGGGGRGRRAHRVGRLAVGVERPGRLVHATRTSAKTKTSNTKSDDIAQLKLYGSLYFACNKYSGYLYTLTGMYFINTAVPVVLLKRQPMSDNSHLGRNHLSDRALT